MGRTVPEAEMKRNHRFFNSSFNKNGTCRRLGFHRHGPGRAGKQAATDLGRVRETTQDTRRDTRPDMAVLLNVIGSHNLPTSESCETSESGPTQTA